MDVSPKYLMALIDEIEAKIWSDFSSYKNVKNYIEKWHQDDGGGNFNDYWENFQIFEKDGKIDLNSTLHNISDFEIIIKIAVDLGIETPGFIVAVPVIKNKLKQNYTTAHKSFENSIKQIEENPSLAIGLANSTLESIIKHILDNDNIHPRLNGGETLYDLAQIILKEFLLFPKNELPIEIKTIGSSLLKISQTVEVLRSTKTVFHGKAKNDYIINDSLYAYFVVNTVSTIGLFLMSFYKKKYDIKNVDPDVNEVEVKNDIEQIPF